MPPCVGRHLALSIPALAHSASHHTLSHTKLCRPPSVPRIRRVVHDSRLSKLDVPNILRSVSSERMAGQAEQRRRATKTDRDSGPFFVPRQAIQLPASAESQPRLASTRAVIGILVRSNALGLCHCTDVITPRGTQAACGTFSADSASRHGFNVSTPTVRQHDITSNPLSPPRSRGEVDAPSLVTSGHTCSRPCRI